MSAHMQDPAAALRESAANKAWRAQGSTQRVCLHPDYTTRILRDTDTGARRLVRECDYCPHRDDQVLGYAMLRPFSAMPWLYLAER